MKVTEREDKRFHIIGVNGNIINDANGRGYKSYNTAMNVMYKIQSYTRRIEEVGKLMKWWQEHESLCVDFYVLSTKYGFDNIPEAKIKTAFIRHGVINSLPADVKTLMIVLKNLFDGVSNQTSEEASSAAI